MTFSNKKSILYAISEKFHRLDPDFYFDDGLTDNILVIVSAMK
jgi:hypothetical protein